jgi:hypothetical protein
MSFHDWATVWALSILIATLVTGFGLAWYYGPKRR